MGNAIAVALGGALGALSRYFLSYYVNLWLGKSFPWGTLLVNMLGSLLMGMSLILLIEGRLELGETWRHFIVIGILGSLTTFSTFSADTLLLIQQGELIKAVLNILVSLTSCLLAVSVGMIFSKQLLS